MPQNRPSRFHEFRNNDFFWFIDSISFHVKVIVDDISGGRNNHRRKDEEEIIQIMKVDLLKTIGFDQVKCNTNHCHQNDEEVLCSNEF
jgi:hypothetical protein